MGEEAQLIDRARNGDHESFRQLVEAHKDMVYNLLYDLSGHRDDAEDLTQEVFIKMYHALNSFRGEAQLKTWVSRIAVNSWVSHRRSWFYKLSSRRADIEQDHSLRIPDRQNPDKKAEWTDLNDRIGSALEQLSRKERTAFILRHYHEYSLMEVAETMKIKTGTVKSLLFRGTRKLRSLLADHRLEPESGGAS